MKCMIGIYTKQPPAIKMSCKCGLVGTPGRPACDHCEHTAYVIDPCNENTDHDRAWVIPGHVCAGMNTHRVLHRLLRGLYVDSEVECAQHQSSGTLNNKRMSHQWPLKLSNIPTVMVSRTHMAWLAIMSYQHIYMKGIRCTLCHKLTSSNVVASMLHKSCL